MTDCGQHAVTVSNASPGGRVDLFYRNWTRLANPTIAELNAIFPGNPDVAAHRWAVQQGYVAGKWNHENEGTHLGVIGIKGSVADMRNPTIAELNAIFPGNPDVAAHRWANQHGYAAGAWNHENDGTHLGVICFRP